MKTNIIFVSYLAQFFLEWEMFRTEVVEEFETHFVFKSVFRKSCRLWDKVEKYCRAGLATGDNMAHVHCILDT